MCGALHAFHDPLASAGMSVSLPEPDMGRNHQAAVEELDALLAPYAGRYPGVPVEPLVLGGPPARALVEASLGASLVVVGRRGRGGFPGLHLGSTSQAILRHAFSPVAVVR